MLYVLYWHSLNGCIMKSPFLSPRMVLLVSILAVSSASILIRMSSAPPIAIAAFRMIISSIILLPFFLYNGGVNRVREMGIKGLISLMAVGIVLAIHFASWITSLSLTSVASSVIFVHIDPIFVAVASHFFLRERIDRITVGGIIIAVLGATVIALGDAGVGEMNLLGDLLALVGGVMLALYILGGRVFRKSLDLTSYVVPVYSTSAIALLIGAVLMKVPLNGYPILEYRLFIAIAIIPMIFGHTLYNWSLKYIEAPIVSISLLGEPLGASVLAALILGEIPGLSVFIGGALTLVGILICAYPRNVVKENSLS
jgi:drug/metabolite transporter (DMT)-like permease